jgi:hypothetical protein
LHECREKALREHIGSDLHGIDGTVDDGGNRQEVKGIIEDFPDIGAAVLSNDFFVEAVSARDLAG